MSDHFWFESLSDDSNYYIQNKNPHTESRFSNDTKNKRPRYQDSSGSQYRKDVDHSHQKRQKQRHWYLQQHKSQIQFRKGNRHHKRIHLKNLPDGRPCPRCGLGNHLSPLLFKLPQDKIPDSVIINCEEERRNNRKYGLYQNHRKSHNPGSSPADQSS